MFTSNPFAELSASVSPAVMQTCFGLRLLILAGQDCSPSDGSGARFAMGSSAFCSRTRVSKPWLRWPPTTTSIWWLPTSTCRDLQALHHIRSRLVGHRTASIRR